MGRVQTPADAGIGEQFLWISRGGADGKFGPEGWTHPMGRHDVTACSCQNRITSLVADHMDDACGFRNTSGLFFRLNDQIILPRCPLSLLVVNCVASIIVVIPIQRVRLRMMTVAPVRLISNGEISPDGPTPIQRGNVQQ